MKIVPVVNENDMEVLDLPGRRLRWLITKDSVDAVHCSMCMIQIAPGQTVKPAHSHPNGEEVIYIISGSGKVMVDGKVEAVQAGCAVLFPQGKVHMLSNTGDEEMKVVCFFAPPSELKTYKFHDGVEFPVV
jgi:quercetin dioxygenase-like cupin family protein